MTLDNFDGWHPLAACAFIIAFVAKLVCVHRDATSAKPVPMPHTSPQRRRAATESSHMLWRYEWIVGLLTMVLLVYLRTAHYEYQEGSWLNWDGSDENIFDDYWDSSSISTKLLSYCSLDVEILCANQGESSPIEEECEAYGPFLSRKLHTTSFVNVSPWHMYHPSPPSTHSAVALGDLHKCALAMQLEINGWPDILGHSLLTNGAVLNLQQQALLKDKDALSVARAIVMVFFGYESSQPYTCTNYHTGWSPPESANYYSLMQATEHEQEMLYAFYLKEMLDIFTTNKAVEGRLVSQKWSVVEFMDIVSAAVRLADAELGTGLLASPQFERVIAKMLEQSDLPGEGISSRHLQGKVVAFPSSSASSGHALDTTIFDEGRVPFGSMQTKHVFQMFPCNNVVDQCMYSHYENKTMVTEVCPKRMNQAQSRMREVQLPLSRDFVLVAHSSFLLVNVVWILLLIRSCSIRNKFKQRLDRKRKHLEQELNDPFLRESLERKAQQLPEADRIRFFAGLERKIKHWDSSEGANTHTKRWIRRFRYMMLFVILLDACFGLFLIKWQVESQAQMLESIFVGVLMWTLSYAVRIPSSKGTSSAAIVADEGLELAPVGGSPAEASKGLSSDCGETVGRAPIVVQ